uniref:Uncharacterized protein n=1 Tax=Anguilla anguilla TaxID=7936 RepID=A0A0E9RXK4_ANGAN
MNIADTPYAANYNSFYRSLRKRTLLQGGL